MMLRVVVLLKTLMRTMIMVLESEVMMMTVMMMTMMMVLMMMTMTMMLRLQQQ